MALQLHTLYQPAPLLPTHAARLTRHAWAQLMASLVLAGGWVRALRGSDWLMIASRWLWIAVRLMLCMKGFLAHRLPVTPLSCRWCGSVPARWRAGAACPRHCSF